MYWKESRGTANAPRRKFRADNIMPGQTNPKSSLIGPIGQCFTWGATQPGMSQRPTPGPERNTRRWRRRHNLGLRPGYPTPLFTLSNP